MRLPRSLPGRFALAGVALVFISLATISFFLIYNVSLMTAAVGIAGLAIALIALALGYFLARSASRSMQSIAEGARRLAAGDLDHRVQASASDETQELAEAFNRMADSLKGMVQNLSSERNRLSAVLATMADGVIVTGPAGNVLLLNQAAEELLRTPRQSAEGKRLVELVRDHNIYRLTSDCLATGKPQHGEVELLRPRRFLSAIATPLSENSSRGVLLTLHDLTRIRQVEASHKEFVSNVSHELRNPLASVKAMVETLEDGVIEGNPVAKDFLERIHRDIDRMNHLVNDLLELSRLESGQLALQISPLELRPLVEEVRLRFSALAEAREVLVEADLPPGLPQVRGDREKLQQVLINLVENALKFTPASSRITLSAQAQNGMVEVKVMDTGAGIAQEHLPHIFERFYKVDRARRDGGTGLGLAIVKQIVEAHRGEVWVESQEGVGSAFTFTVPQAK
jgi:two-component system, OmpR family, phosphate regulon sensor histidine kinase PhoR